MKDDDKDFWKDANLTSPKKTIKKYKSKACAAIHGSMRALYKIKAIDKKTMSDFDKGCLQYTSDEIMVHIKKELDNEVITEKETAYATGYRHGRALGKLHTISSLKRALQKHKKTSLPLSLLIKLGKHLKNKKIQL